MEESWCCLTQTDPELASSASLWGAGRALGAWLSKLAREWRATAAGRMPEARGDIREILGQPVFVPLFKLFLAYGPIFRLSFGPKTFVVISDAALIKQVCRAQQPLACSGLQSFDLILFGFMVYGIASYFKFPPASPVSTEKPGENRWTLSE